MADAAVQLRGEILGAEDVAAGLMDAASLITQRLLITMTALGTEVANVARGLAPRRSGALQASIRPRVRWTKTGVSLLVKPGKFYGQFVEFGVVNHGTGHVNKRPSGNKAFQYHRVRQLRAAGQWRQKPHPFMAPARDLMRKRIEDRISEAIGAAVEVGV